MHAKIKELSEKSEVRCWDAETSELMKIEIDNAKENGDTLGGAFEIYFENVPIGLGSYVHYDRAIDGKIAQAVMSIPAVKSVEIGAGCKWSQIYYNDKTEYKYKQSSSGGSDVTTTLKGYSMVAGLPLMDVEKGNIITWNFEFNTELNGRKMYVKYGPFDGKTVEGDDITAYDADKKKNELKFTAKKSDMIFVKWGSGNTLITSGSATLIKETFKDN